MIDGRMRASGVCLCVYVCLCTVCVGVCVDGC